MKKFSIFNFQFSIFFFLLTLSTLLTLSLTFARSAKAAQQRNDTAIFTGQVIPAYIGGAYDPTEGFKKLAGLPIYVFAYDNWQGNNFVIHNFAVRTQIRADGSFQAQGLPTAAHYGVYFPFFGDPGGNVTRRDGLPDAPQTAEFRWPVENDQIRDVFSYTVGNGGEAVQIVDQFGNPITLGQAFLTNERKLDIDNTINVFPLIPHRALRVTIALSSTEQSSSYEVYAQRVTQKMERRADQPQGLGIVNSPIVRGRTSTGTQSGGTTYGTFQAYAPDGFYAISVWRTEGGSVSYKDWNGSDPVNSTNTGLGFLYVDKDWQQQIVRGGSETAVAHRNHLISVWGIVSDERGFPMSTLNRGPLGLTEIEIGIVTDTDLIYTPKYDPQKDVTDENKTRDFYSCCGGRDLNDKTVYGVYALYQYITDGSIPTPLNEHYSIYIATSGYKKVPTASPDIIEGTDGPVRIDITASKSEADNPSGYDTGLHIYTDYSISEVRVITQQDTKFFIPALQKVYSADRLGEVHIPDYDLKRNLEYFIEVRAGNKLTYETVVYPDTGYQAIDLVPSPVAYNNRYYKILGLVPIPIVIADDNVQSVIQGVLHLPSEAKVENIEFFILKPGMDREQQCLPEDGCEVDTTQIADGLFTVKIVRPVSPEEGEPICEEWMGVGGCLRWRSPEFYDNYKIIVRGSYQTPDGKTTPLTGEYLVTIKDNGIATPPQIEVYLNTDCTKIVPSCGYPVIGGLVDFLKRIPCEIPSFLTEKMASAFGILENYILNTRPITQEAGLVKVWNVVRNIVNVLFIIFLLIIGITTILRIEPKTWSPGSLIPKLFLAIFFANFSLLIVQLLIDINNVLTHFIFQYTYDILRTTEISDKGILVVGGAVPGIAVAHALAAAIGGVGASALAGLVGTGGALLVPMLLFILSALASVFFLILGFVLIFIIRYAVLWIAAILAPIVFALGVLPAAAQFQSMWWNTVLPFTIMQTVAAFLLSIGLLLLSIGSGGGTFFWGFGSILVGIVTLFMALKIPGTVGSWFKGGLIGGKELGGITEGIGKKGAEWKKENLTKEKVARGIAQVRGGRKGEEMGRGQRMVTGAAGFIKGVAGNYEEEEAIVKAIKEGTEAGMGKTPREQVEKEQIIRASGVRPDAYNTLETWLSNIDQNTSLTAKDRNGNLQPMTVRDFRREHQVLDKKGNRDEGRSDMKAIQSLQSMAKEKTFTTEKDAYNKVFNEAKVFSHARKT